MTSLSDQLKSSKSASSRVIFIELKAEVMTAINAGWTLKDAWNLLSTEEKFPFSYALFVRHFNRFCKDEKPADKGQDRAIQQPVPTFPQLPASPKNEKPAGPIIAGKPKKNPFVDPDPMVNGEDLI